MQHCSEKKRPQWQSLAFDLSISFLIAMAVFSFSAEREYIEERTYSKKGQLQKTIVRKKEQCRLDSQAIFVQDEKKDKTSKHLVLAVLAVAVISSCSYRSSNS